MRHKKSVSVQFLLYTYGFSYSYECKGYLLIVLGDSPRSICANGEIIDYIF
jgi:hypothetical protein